LHESARGRSSFVNIQRSSFLVFKLDAVSCSETQGASAVSSSDGLPPRTAQNIRHMWMREGERLDPKLHTMNRYGVKLGDKVPVWGGFTGAGEFTLRLWTPTPKMKKVEWARYAPDLRRAAMQTPGASSKMWHDNESFLINPTVYHKHGMQSVRFPPCSGDLNPIETVWARLRRDLGSREMEDLRQVFADGTVQAARGTASEFVRCPGARPNAFLFAAACSGNAAPLGKVPSEQIWA